MPRSREGFMKRQDDRVRFLETLAEACAKPEWRVHAWCLMGNPLKAPGKRAPWLGMGRLLYD